MAPDDGMAAGEADPGIGSGGADEALRRLEERLDRASDAAERLMAEAAQSAARTVAGAARAATGSDSEQDDSRQPPPSGWQVPGGDGDERGELELLAQVLQSVRDLIPPELERRLAEALRELLLAVRALIDWYLERSERRKAGPAEVQDIPIS